MDNMLIALQYFNAHNRDSAVKLPSLIDANLFSSFFVMSVMASFMELRQCRFSHVSQFDVMKLRFTAL